MSVKRVCGCLTFGAVAGVVVFFTAAAVVLLYGPDTSISF